MRTNSKFEASTTKVITINSSFKGDKFDPYIIITAIATTVHRTSYFRALLSIDWDKSSLATS